MTGVVSLRQSRHPTSEPSRHADSFLHDRDRTTRPASDAARRRRPGRRHPIGLGSGKDAESGVVPARSTRDRAVVHRSPARVGGGRGLSFRRRARRRIHRRGRHRRDHRGRGPSRLLVRSRRVGPRLCIRGGGRTRPRRVRGRRRDGAAGRARDRQPSLGTGAHEARLHPVRCRIDPLSAARRDDRAMPIRVAARLGRWGGASDRSDVFVASPVLRPDAHVCTADGNGLTLARWPSRDGGLREVEF